MVVTFVRKGNAVYRIHKMCVSYINCADTIEEIISLKLHFQ